MIGITALLAVPAYGNSNVNVEALFKQACVIGHFKCKGVVMPTVALTALPPGVLGAYTPETPDVIYVDFNMLYGRVVDLRATIVHETIHYLDHVVKGNPMDTYATVCASEVNAWRATNDWYKKIGQPSKANYGWKAWYPACS